MSDDDDDKKDPEKDFWGGEEEHRLRDELRHRDERPWIRGGLTALAISVGMTAMVFFFVFSICNRH